VPGSSYIFFDAELRERFVQALAARGLACTQRADAMEGEVVELVTDPDDDTLAALEAEYEALQQEQMVRAESRADWGSHQVVSLSFVYPDGRSGEVRLPPAVARALLERYTADEARELVAAIAHSLQQPLTGPLCRRDLFSPP